MATADVTIAFKYAEYSQTWLESLKQAPAVNPSDVETLETNINEAVHQWLLDHAPAEICDLMNAAGSMRQLVREYEFTKGFVSPSSNACIKGAIADAFEAAGKLGIAIIDEE